MIKAYLDSYDKITVNVSKNYYGGKISSLYMLTKYGPQKLKELELSEKFEDYIEYNLKLEEEIRAQENIAKQENNEMKNKLTENSSGEIPNDNNSSTEDVNFENKANEIIKQINDYIDSEKKNTNNLLLNNFF